MKHLWINRVATFRLLVCIVFLHIVSSKIMGQNTEPKLTASSWYNQGVDAYEEKNYGDAVYFFEKAKLLDPQSDNIAINLKLAVEHIESDIVELDGFFLANWWESFNELFSPGIWKILSVLFFLAMSVLIYLFLIRGKGGPKSRVMILGVVLFLLSMLCMFSGNSRANAIYKSPYAIVKESGKQLFEGPDEVSENVKVVSHGVKVKIMDKSGEWYKVSTMDSEQGWIKANKIRLLSF